MSQKTEKEFKLTYFNAKGVAEVVRLMFAVVNRKGDYEDNRVAKEEWAKLKPTMPMKAMPILQYGGETICQSGAIARFVAKKLDLMGKSDMDAFHIDEIQETMSELFQKHIFKMFGESDDTKKKALLETFMKEALDDYLKLFQTRLSENKSKSGYFVGDKPTLADIVVYRGFEMVGEILKKSGCDLAPKLAAYKEVDALCKKVAALPSIVQWVKERPETEF